MGYPKTVPDGRKLKPEKKSNRSSRRGSPHSRGRAARSYHLDCGNSTFGPVGIRGRVVANSKQDALRKLRRVLEDGLGSAGQIAIPVEQQAIEYVNVYISPENIKASDITGE